MPGGLLSRHAQVQVERGPHAGRQQQRASSPWVAPQRARPSVTTALMWKPASSAEPGSAASTQASSSGRRWEGRFAAGKMWMGHQGT